MSINDILIDEFGAELDVLKVRLTYLVKLIWQMIFSHSLSHLSNTSIEMRSHFRQTNKTQKD